MKNKFKKILLAVTLVIAISIIAVFINRPRFSLPETEKEQAIKGISFADTGSDTILTDSRLESYEEKFGNDFIESWSPIEFNDFPVSFYENLIPEIILFKEILSHKDSREHSGEKSIKIKYPYVEKISRLFNDVNLTFSGISKKPMIFRIKGFQHIQILDNLKSKYSDPKIFIHENREFNVWKKQDSILISHTLHDRLNRPYVKITIYYLKNLKDFFAEIENPQSNNRENIF